MAGDGERAAARVAAALRDGDDPVAVLGLDVPGADLTSFLLEVMGHRAAAVTPAGLVQAGATNRLCEPGVVDARALHRTIALLTDALPAGFELVELSPVAPLGSCSAIATVDQRKVVSTVRGVEVAADPTNTLAALAATRRTAATTVRLAAAQRVLRAQPQGGGQAHFTLLGLVIAGRDQGNLAFERAAAIEMVTTVVGLVRAVTAAPVEVRMTNLRDEYTAAIIDTVRVTTEAATDVRVTTDPDRTAGRGYYRDLCFKVVAGSGGDAVEVGDGGFTDWTRQLAGNRKERLLIGGLGVDRIATLAPPPS